MLRNSFSRLIYVLMLGIILLGIMLSGCGSQNVVNYDDQGQQKEVVYEPTQANPEDSMGGVIGD